MQADDVLLFWFNPDHQPYWFAKDAQFDQLILDQFNEIHHKASKGELWNWRHDAEGRLAEIIVLDQFSRNLFRDQAKSFSQDAMALALAQEAISLKLDHQLNPLQRKFLYLPFMHSESQHIHEFALKLFQRLGDDEALEYEKRHRDIIQRFGHYPHRNEILGRVSTAEELEFLSHPYNHF